MIERKHTKQANIAVFMVSHSTYDGQFPGLYDNFYKYHADFIKLVEENGVTVTDFGMVDSSEKAYETADNINKSCPDLIICNMITYATSSVFAPIIRNCSAPVILTALQPRGGLDYTKASTFMQLENDNICSVPEFMGVANRLGKKIYDVIIGKLYGDEDAKKELSDWCDIACVLHSLKGARMGLMGHTLEAMYDMHADPTMVSSAFGVHVPLLEIDDVLREYDLVTEEEIAAKEKIIDEEFDCPEPVSDPVTSKLTPEDKRQAAKTAAFWLNAIDKKAALKVSDICGIFFKTRYFYMN